ncbi:uncharacterized protein FFM5_15315 [Fusarium fujikuroi]|nr:uncharacterized protein FFM5_15315 [Fusarium fujikuroi]
MFPNLTVSIIVDCKISI